MAADTVLLSLLALAVVSTISAATFVAARTRGWSVVGALGAGLIGIGATSWLTLIVTSIGESAGRVLAVVLFIAAVAVLLHQRAWRWSRAAAPLATASFGALLFALSMLLMWNHEGDAFTEAEGRFYANRLPIDDQLPSLLATWIATRQEGEFLVGDWLPSDRPPLQAGIILVFRALSVPIAAVLGAPGVTVDYAASTAAQVLWLPACFAVLTALGYRRRSVYAALAFAAIVPVVFVNTVYTWPKLLAAAFAIAALAALVAALRGTERPTRALVLAAALSAFALLSHGASAFVLPLILALAIVLLRRMDRRRRWWAAIAAVTAPAVLYLPWLLYQRFAYPPGDRLLKWHFAGVIALDDRSFVGALIDQYRATPLGEIVAARWENIGRAFDPLLVFSGLNLGQPGAMAARADREFFDTPSAIGLTYLLALALLVVWIVVRGRRPSDATLSWSALIVAGMLACILLWTLVMFVPGSSIVHQGSHVWILLLLVVPFAWLARTSCVASIALAAIQLAWSLVIYVPDRGDTDAALHRSVVAVGLAGLALLVSSAFWRDGREQRLEAALPGRPPAFDPTAKDHFRE